MSFPIYVAPLQGYTDAEWRLAHRRIYGDGATAYYSPFLRVEHGEVRQRDLRDTTPTNEYLLVPQIIFRNKDEFTLLVEALERQGYRQIDLNIGCPFPPQVKRGRGAGALLHPEMLKEIGVIIERLPHISFSVKMRLGVDALDQWRNCASVLNSMQLSHVTIHPRIARQGYKGELQLNELEECISAIAHPIIYNGGVCAVEDIDRAMTISGISGVMIGRGLLRRPSLIEEWRSQREWTAEERFVAMCRFHQSVYDLRRLRLSGGEAQVLQSMRTFWDYADGEVDRHFLKSLRKATSLSSYISIISNEI